MDLANKKVKLRSLKKIKKLIKCCRGEEYEWWDDNGSMDYLAVTTTRLDAYSSVRGKSTGDHWSIHPWMCKKIYKQ